MTLDALIMKQLLTVLICGSLLVCGTTQTRKPERLLVAQQVAQLKKTYQQLVDRPTAANERAYFEAFPPTFAMLNAMFGYGEVIEGQEYGPAPLYGYQFEFYVDTFFNLSTVGQINFYNRLIDIGSEGKWDADTISHFQNWQIEIVKNNLTDFCPCLAKREDDVIKGFWYFYFDRPHPPQTISQALQSVKQLDGHIYQLMEAALKDTHKGACQGH